MRSGALAASCALLCALSTPPLGLLAEEPAVDSAAQDSATQESGDAESLFPDLPVALDAGDLPFAREARLEMPLEFTADDDRVAAYFVGSVDWRYTFADEQVRLQCDLLVIYADLADRIEEADDVTGDASRGELGTAPQTVATIAGQRFSKYSFYAQGRVRLDVAASRTHIEAASLFYEHPTGLGLARGVRLMTSVDRAHELGRSILEKVGRHQVSTEPPSRQPLYRSPVVIRADALRIVEFRYFHGANTKITSSSFAVPPLALASETVEVYPVSTTQRELDALRTLQLGAPALATSAGARALRERYEPEDEGGPPPLLIDPESTWVTVFDQPVVPLPLGYWDTRWHDFLPIRTVDAGNSSSFGTFAEVNWNLNYFLRLTPLERAEWFRRIDKSWRLGFDTSYYDERGFRYGPNAQYGRHPRRWESWQELLETGQGVRRGGLLRYSRPW